MRRGPGSVQPQGTLKQTTVCLLVVGVAFVVSRLCYATFLDVGFDASPLAYYVQYLDPLLLRDDLLRSIANLHSQPPAFNLFLGLVLKAFPAQHDVAFHVLFLATGLLLGWMLLVTMLAFGVGRRLATGLTVVATCEPTTVLYEQWLFYTYPLMLLIVSALWLLRRATTTQGIAAYAGFFLCLALVVLTRSTYHAALFAVVAATVWALSDRRRTVAFAAAPAVLVLLAVYGNAWARFGAWSLGDSYAGVNAPVMVFSHLPKDTHEAMVAAGEIGGTTLVIRRSGVVSPLAAYRPYVPQLAGLEPTGVPALDTERKSNGWVNFNHQGFRVVADLAMADSLHALRRHPEAYLRYVADNVRRYGLGREQAFPFSEPQAVAVPNRRDNAALVALCRTLGLADVAAVPWLKLVGFVLLTFWAACLAIAGLRAGDRSLTACMVFALAMIAPSYVLVLVSFGDHSRYRAEVDPIYLVLLATLLQRTTSGASWWTRRPAGW